MLKYYLFGLLVLTLAIALCTSLHLGLRLYTPVQVWAALTAPDTSEVALIVNGLRVPRTLAACGVGAALAVCGLLMQSVLRNPLADPGLLGVNAGASFAVVFAFSVFGVSSLHVLSIFALAGATMATCLLYMLLALAGGRMTSVTLVLAGVSLAAMLSALTQVLIVTDEGTMEALLFWLAGGFADRDPQMLWVALPVIGVGVLLAAPLAQGLQALQIGEPAAQAIGVNVARLRIIALALATVLAGICVTIAGPVGFVGLVAPHLASMTGVQSFGWRIGFSALIGSTLAVCADIAARLVVAPQEAPVTAMLALVGAPVLIALVRRQDGAVA
ncbi:iron complex transport system permease protein [Yoonia tamlensis]|uniref:Iron complex transport system permease protein n=1 Tax=Yoonia tamlensis TaxID=390270 RepID=A0A1I6FNU9_9RHOB|nr:iron ABC transporter permease [Yoonia tamlensis]SFR31544.1 iron complex transport system permease protein [Yoonia tamlensis]